MKTLIPFPDHLSEKLGYRYPNIVADDGYESEENDLYLESHHQNLIIKPLILNPKLMNKLKLANISKTLENEKI